MKAFARRILGFRGIHYVASRFGWKGLRGLSFDAKFKQGDWVFAGENPDLVQLVEKYSSRGHILALGCGTAPIAGALNPQCFQTFLGVDLSAEAINLAGKHASEKIRFERGDMLQHQDAQAASVILFSDSVYYAPWYSRKGLLSRLSGRLAPGGRIIVTLSQPARYAGIIQMIRGNFNVEVDRALQQTCGHVLVFY